MRVRIDGSLYELSEKIHLDKNIKHSIEIVVDRLIVRDGIQKRLTDSIETALGLSGGLMMVDQMDGTIVNFSQNFACPDCGISIDEVEPRSFSFNNPLRGLPGLLWSRLQDGVRRGPADSGQISVHQSGGDCSSGMAVLHGEGQLYRAILDAPVPGVPF